MTDGHWLFGIGYLLFVTGRPGAHTRHAGESADPEAGEAFPVGSSQGQAGAVF